MYPSIGIVFADDKDPSTLYACAKFGCFRCSDASRASESCLLMIKIRAFSIGTMFTNVIINLSHFMMIFSFVSAQISVSDMSLIVITATIVFNKDIRLINKQYNQIKTKV